MPMATILYGECIAPGQTAKVRISGLADQGCDLETDACETVSDGDVSLWIGAVGPFHASATRKDACHVAVRFKEPIDGRILEHFRCG
ncbi:hypothetical protein [Novosphingobium album (ex Hu et al. 2023)]|uniref:PilZ domain-containing protein n=1 Tax=Novosphingobium album (ex Hu et al. 2023) TaxID=2930093 RepID=A0ABT0B698_9SPHN|nr:hypothetical protein [Novosphingobium album (ex Hu et al. 2023)]MCJ2180533.1 hypothetical protein [Novosphingobium album (ex Hu et al. 2023)]